MTAEPWQAPRTAYLLTAAVAERDAAAADKIWKELDECEHADLLTALAAQFRAALHLVREHHRAAFEGYFDISEHMIELCGQAQRALNAILQDRAWELPECRHCHIWMGAAMASMTCKLSNQELGMSAELIAHTCRRAAASAASA